MFPLTPRNLVMVMVVIVLLKSMNDMFKGLEQIDTRSLRQRDCQMQCNTTADAFRLCECETVVCLEIVCQCQTRRYDVAVVADKLQCRRQQTYDGIACSAEETESIARAKPIANSNCPDNRQWMRAALEHTDPLKPVVLVSVGCNKGDDLLNMMHAWTRNSSYKKWMDQSTLSARSCPVQLQDDTQQTPPRSGSAFCIEPLSSNAQYLRGLMAPFNSHIHVVHAAASSASGSVSFAVGTEGSESYGIGTDAAIYETVPLIQLDELLLEETIDLLSIDAEGHDMKVLEGKNSSTQNHKI